MSNAHAAIDCLLSAGALTREDPLRRGSLLEFPNCGQLVMTGDLRGHARNFTRLVNYCNLDCTPGRHVILHEIVHAAEDSPEGCDLSHEVLLKAVQWKIAHPDQVHLLQSNHELSELTGHDITRGGRSSMRAFREGLTVAYGDGPAQEVLAAITQLIRSLPLAGRTSNRVFVSHSLPDARKMDTFDPDVVHREPTATDLACDGSAGLLLRGRQHTPEQLRYLAKRYNVDYFVVGHQRIETGHKLAHLRMLVLASDHDHGEFLPFDLRKPCSMEGLVRRTRPCSAAP